MRLLIFIVCLFYFISANGQSQYSYYPEQFGQYMRHSRFTNPASIGSHSKLEVALGGQNHLGNFSSISTYFAGLSYSLRDETRNERPFSVIGLNIDTDQEGKYISRNRFYIVYAFHFRIFSNYFLSGGVDFGTLNLSVKGTPSVGGKSEFVPDANSGIWLYNHDFYMGISVNQIFNGHLQPYQEISRLRRHYNITFMRQFKINSLMTIKPSLLFRFPSYLNYNADYSMECLFAGFVGGISLRYKLGGAFWLGMKDISFFSGKMEAVICYNTPLKSSLLNVSSLEIICSYGL